MPEAIEAQVAALDASAQAVVRMLWHVHEEQMATFRSLQQQLAERDAKLAVLQTQNERFRQMIFGRRSEKLPPISSEVRRAVEAEDFPLDVPAGATSRQVEQAKTKARRQRGRKASTTARGRRRKALEKLPVIVEQIKVTAQQFPEGMTREGFRPLGEGEVVRQIEHVREHLAVVEHSLEKLAERGGEARALERRTV